ncbi:MAG: hypothetical protein ACI39F_00040 [Acutalibacteraceae bacterium]
MKFYRECHFCGGVKGVGNGKSYNTLEEAYAANNKEEDLICGLCGQHVCKSDFTGDELDEIEEYEKILYDFYVKPNPENHQYYLKRLETERKHKEKCEKIREKLREENPKSFAKAASGNSDNEITCPTCHSTNVVKIDGLERGASILMWGLFSKKRDKTFKCKHCGYMW